MPVPSVDITQVDFVTGVVPPSSEGILAIIGPTASGVVNVPTPVTRDADAVSTFGVCPLTEFASYVMSASGKPVVIVAAATTTDGSYGTITAGTGGTATMNAAGATKPLDSYSVVIKWVTGGALGTAGAQYTYSLDGGKNTSGVKALGTALNLVIPDTGITLILGTSTQTIVAGRTVTFSTTGGLSSLSANQAALTALGDTATLWEAALILGDSDGTAIAAYDTQLSNLSTNRGKKRFVIVNAAMMGASSEATYLASMQTLRAAASSKRVVVCADGGYLSSALRKDVSTQLARPTSLALAGRLMGIDMGTDPAFVADGPVKGFQIKDSKGNGLFHDEYLNPGIDAVQITTLRSFEKRGGAFITNANVFSDPGSDFVWAQHVRIENRAEEVALDVLNSQLSRGVNTKPDAGPQGQVYIREDDHDSIEALCQTALNQALKGRVTGVRFLLHDDDDIGSNGPAVLTGEIQIASKKYVKRISLTSGFVRTL